VAAFGSAEAARAVGATFSSYNSDAFAVHVYEV
jgi:hypothetical protein